MGTTTAAPSCLDLQLVGRMDPDNTVWTYGAAGGKELGPLVQQLRNDTLAKGEALGRRMVSCTCSDIPWVVV
jgi:hypothetical protein